MGFGFLKKKEYDGSEKPRAVTSLYNYIIENGKVVYTDAMMCYGGDITGNLIGATETEIRRALDGKLTDLSEKAREKFIEECVIYFPLQGSVTPVTDGSVPLLKSSKYTYTVEGNSITRKGRFPGDKKYFKLDEANPSSDVRNVLQDELSEVSNEERSKFIQECIYYFKTTSVSKRMTDADYAAEAGRNKTGYDPRENSPGKRASLYNEDDTNLKRVVGKLGDVELLEKDIRQMMVFIHDRMPKSMTGNKPSMLEDVIDYLNTIEK